MSGWRWDRVAEPVELARYVQQDLARKLLPSELAQDLPGPGGQAPAEKARLIFEVFARRGVRYVDEPSTSVAGGQTVRPVDQVLARPRQATCLDICVAYAGACLDAGLHPVIVVLDARRGASSHAIVLVWLDGSWSASARDDYPLEGVVHENLPVTGDGFALPGEVRASVGGSGSFLAVDVTGATWRPGASGPAKDWSGAVRDGAVMLTAAGSEIGAWRWAVGVDVGVARHTTAAWDLEDWRPPSFEPLTPAYTEPNPAAGPLTQIKARQGVVPFHARDELDLLLEWAQATSSAPDGVELAVVYGVGGAGKTHLAAEVCRRLDSAGWYAGFLAKHPVADRADLAWLSGVVSPVLVVIDYVEDTAADDVIAVVKALRGREEPTRILLTARSIGQWLVSITAGTGRDGVGAAEPLSVPLPRRHPASAGVFRRAAQRFAQLPGMSATTVDKPPDNPRWTTLDLVLQAWLAATGLSRDALPTKRDPLYDQILEREFEYWLRTCQKRGLPEYPLELFARAGAVLTLLAPATPARATRALTAIEELAPPTLDRATLIDVLTGMLTPDNTADGFAVRPDPVGERLVLRELTGAGQLMDRCVPPDPSHDERLTKQPNDPDAQAEAQACLVEGFRACTVLTRAAELDTPAATALTRRLLDRHPYLWPAGMSVAINQGGPFATTLTELAEQQDSPLPLAQLANDIPLGHASLRPLALIATQRSRPRPDPAAEEPDNLNTLAAWWNNLALRRGDIGDRAGALAAIDEAVTLRRQLAETNPAAFLPDLAMSLNNQANQRSEVGDRGGALAAIDEAVTLRRQLAETNPAAFLPDLAASLNNQAVRRGEVGDRGGALAAIDEAVTLRRQLAETNPAAFLPDLAMSLNNQAALRGEVGDRGGALAAIDEAVTGYRQLAETNPAAFLPDLAASLNNQAVRRGEVGDRGGALAAIDEAVTLRRQLAETNPAAFLPDLAMSLNNQAALRGEVGDRGGALAAIDEAVTGYRQLAETNPAAFLPNLAGSLNNQAALRGEVGDRGGALAAIDEAVTLRRQLAETNPAAFLPDLAMSLNNQANQRSEVGDRGGALAAIDEAVTGYRQLAETNPAAFLPDLAMSLNNLANQRSEVGDRGGALMAFVDCWTGFTAGPRAELMAARGRWRLSHTDPAGGEDLDGVIEDLRLAASTAAEPDQPARSGAARRAVQATAAHLRETSPKTQRPLAQRLPAWVSTDIPEPVLNILNQWLATRDWAARETLIQENAAALLAQSGQAGVALARFLYPETEDLTELSTLLERIRADGLDPVLSAYRDTHTHAHDLRAWLATPTWEASRTFVKQHPNLISDPRTSAMLKSVEQDPTARQHLAILRLIQTETAGSLDDIFDAVIDPTVAADLAMTCLERPDTTTLDDLLQAAPNLTRTAFVGPYLLAARIALSGPDNPAKADPRPMIELAIQTGTPTQRAAGATRLRRIARGQPAAAATLTELATQLDTAHHSGTG